MSRTHWYPYSTHSHCRHSQTVITHCRTQWYGAWHMHVSHTLIFTSSHTWICILDVCTLHIQHHCVAHMHMDYHSVAHNDMPIRTNQSRIFIFAVPHIMTCTPICRTRWYSLCGTYGHALLTCTLTMSHTSTSTITPSHTLICAAAHIRTHTARTNAQRLLFRLEGAQKLNESLVAKLQKEKAEVEKSRDEAQTTSADLYTSLQNERLQLEMERLQVLMVRCMSVGVGVCVYVCMCLYTSFKTSTCN